WSLRRLTRCIIPLLSCWESQAEGIDERAQRGEAGLNRLDVREGGETEPGQEQAGIDVGRPQQPQRGEVALPPPDRHPRPDAWPSRRGRAAPRGWRVEEERLGRGR